jgi:hypothetical protein
MKKLIQVLGLIACISAASITPCLAILASEPVFNVGIVDPDTHLIESFLVCGVDYNTAATVISDEEAQHLHKLLAIFDDTARFAGDNAKIPCLRLGA